MKAEAWRSSSPFTIVWSAAVRRPYLCVSVLAHAALLALLYYFGSYQLTLRQQEAEVASSLRATSEASSAARLRDLQTIKQLLEKSAGRGDSEPEPDPATRAAPETPRQMLDQARELSKAIDALNKDIQAEELAKLTGAAKPTTATEAPTAASENAVPQAVQASAPAEPPQRHEAEANDGGTNDGKPQADDPRGGKQVAVTQEAAAGEIAALEAKARATLAQRARQLQAKANGVPVEADSQGARAGQGATPGKGGGRDSSVGAAIADFIGADRPGGETAASKRYFGNKTSFFDHGAGRIPPVDVATLVAGHGRMLGAGGQYASRVYLNSWYIIGPFAGRHEGGLFDNPSYPPEKAVLLDAVYYGKDKRLLKWRYVTAQSYPLVPPDAVEDAVYYGYTEVFVDQACDLTAWIGADDDVQIYLNDHMVWKGGNVNKQGYFNQIFDDGDAYLRDYNRTEGRRVLHFNKGRNKLFFKLSNGPNSAFLSMVLTR